MSAARIGTNLAQILAASARGVLAVALAFAVIVAAGSAHAQTVVTWTGTGGNLNWSTTNNWSAGGPPTTTGTWSLSFSGTNQMASNLIQPSDDIGGTSSTITVSNLSFLNTGTVGLFYLQRAGSRTLTLTDGATVTTASGSTSVSDRIYIPLVTTGSVTTTLNGHGINVYGGITGGGTIIHTAGGLNFFTASPGSSNFSIKGGSVGFGDATSVANATGTYTLDGGSNPNLIFSGGSFAGTVALLQSGVVRNYGGSGQTTFSSAVFNSKTAAASDVILSLNQSGNAINDIQGVIQDNTSRKVGVSLTLSAPGWRFTGNNTYTGTTNLTVAGANLFIGNGGTTGALSPSSSITGVAGATLAFNRSDTVTQGTDFASVIGGAINLTKQGSGTLLLNGLNTYSGTTQVSAGQLHVTSSGSINNTASVVVNGAGAEFRYNAGSALTKPLTLTQGTLSGTGTIGTAVTVGSSAILSPGNSPGTQSFTQGLTFAQGGQYTWEINNWAGAAGTGYDQLAVSGSALNITATSGSTFKILVTSLTGSNTAGAVPGFVGTTGTTFTIATSSPAITGFDRSKFTIDSATAFGNVNTLPTNAGFWLSTNGGSTSLILNYAPSATYNLSAAASATAIRVGGTSTITATVTSSTASLANPDTMSYAGLALNGGLGTLSSTSGTVAPGSSSSGNVAFTPVGSGSFTFSPSVTIATNVNLATNANAGTTSGVTVSVYNPASANSVVSAVSLGNVYASGTFGTQSLSIWNTGTAAAAYQEGLAAAIGGTSGQASGSGSFTNLFTSSASTAISVGLGGSASTGSAGVKSGTITLGFTSTGTTSVGATGLSPLALDSQSVAVTGTVWNPAAVNAITSPVSLGNVRVSGSFGTQALSIQNTAASGSFTEVLGATGSTSGLASLTGSVAGLAGGGTSTAISVGLGGNANTATAGVKSGSATISFTSTGGPGTAVISSQTVAISGTVWNPAAATTSGSVNLGSVIVGSTSAWTQALSVTNSAPNTGFSEKLNASFGTLSGVTTNSGSFNLLAAGLTNTTALMVSLATGSVGNQSGSAQILFATDGQGTSGLDTASLSPQTVNVYGTVLDHALPGFVGAGITDPYAQTTLNLDFGSVDESAGIQMLTYSLTNLASQLYSAGLTAGLDLTAFTPDGGGFSSGLSTFNNLGAGTSSLFTASFTPSGQGTFSKTFTLSFSDNRNLAGATSVRSLTINTQVVVVPEPGAIALAGIGVAAAAWALRRRTK